MKQSTLPGSDVTVSQLALGCWGLTSDFHWGQRDSAAAQATVAAALDAGITLFDTATMYADGANETLLGELLAGKRNEVQIATKCTPAQTTADAVAAGLDASLTRLKTDYVDLYQIHWAGTDEELAEVWGALIQLKQLGKARAVGVCNLGPKQLDVVSSLEKPSTNQLPYNLLFRAIENEILPRCKTQKMGVLAYSPLMHGMLRGEWKTADEVPPTRARSRHFSSQREHVRHDEDGHETLTFDTIECLQQFADVSHNTMVELALRWLASNPQITSILVGASSPEQIAANAEAIARPLDKELLKQVNQVTDPLKQAMGTNADLWQSAAGSRIH
ncbi:aldo/keto reductase [Rosistilla oblonga]|uniref:aldo/keto reductase n=1 Tax=Rosistilla oblonga TaxID=2527990 RepID=UPI003A97C09D